MKFIVHSNVRPGSRKKHGVSATRPHDVGQFTGCSGAQGDGRIVYSASTEVNRTGRIGGLVPGLLGADGTVCWTELADANGGRFEGGAEGLSLHRAHPDRIRFVIDDDDEDLPSMLYEAGFSEVRRG